MALAVTSSPLPPPPSHRRLQSATPIPAPSAAPAPAPKAKALPLLSDVGRDPTAIKYYSRVASNLAGVGRLRDFLLAAEGLRSASGDAGFAARISWHLLSRGVAAALRDHGLPHVLHFLRDADRVGIRAAAMLDGDASDDVAAACRLLLGERSMTEVVEAVEALAHDVAAACRLLLGERSMTEFVESDALFILLVEKDTAFMGLAEDRFYNRFPCIILTAKGQPDVATRLFLRWLKVELKLPVLALVDSDPYGLKIL